MEIPDGTLAAARSPPDGTLASARSSPDGTLPTEGSRPPPPRPTERSRRNARGRPLPARRNAPDGMLAAARSPPDRTLPTERSRPPAPRQTERSRRSARGRPHPARWNAPEGTLPKERSRPPAPRPTERSRRNARGRPLLARRKDLGLLELLGSRERSRRKFPTEPSRTPAPRMAERSLWKSLVSNRITLELLASLPNPCMACNKIKQLANAYVLAIFARFKRKKLSFNRERERERERLPQAAVRAGQLGFFILKKSNFPRLFFLPLDVNFDHKPKITFSKIVTLSLSLMENQFRAIPIRHLCDNPIQNVQNKR